jgi:hypothetical protein
MPLRILFYLFILGICICSLFNVDSNSNYIASNVWTLVNNELENTWKGSGLCLNEGAIRTLSWRY